MAKKYVPEVAKAIGRNLRRIRMEKNLSQKSLADLWGVTFQQVQKYESGVNRVPIEKMYYLAQRYDISYHGFFKGVDVEGAENYSQHHAELDMSIMEIAHSIEDLTLKSRLRDIARILAA